MSRHLVAVYGTLRQGGHNNKLLHSSEHLGEDFVRGVMYDNGGFPYLVLDESGTEVVVEVYRVDESTLRRLDWLEGYDGDREWNHYDRSLVELCSGTRALVYHVEKEMVKHLPVIESGNWFVK